MKCREKFCDTNISLTAEKCPKCGFDVQAFLRNQVSDEPIGIPIDPIEYWSAWYFFYWWGMPNTKVVLTDSDWVEKGDIIFSLGSMQITAPFSGVVLSSQSGFDGKNETVNPSKEIGYFFKCQEFFQMKPLKSEFYSGIGHIYDPVRDYIFLTVEKKQRSLGAKLFKSSVKRSIDPKDKCSTVEEVLKTANLLRDIQAVTLTGSTYGLLFQRDTL